MKPDFETTPTKKETNHASWRITPLASSKSPIQHTVLHGFSYGQVRVWRVVSHDGTLGEKDSSRDIRTSKNGCGVFYLHVDIIKDISVELMTLSDIARFILPVSGPLESIDNSKEVEDQDRRSAERSEGAKVICTGTGGGGGD